MVKRTNQHTNPWTPQEIEIIKNNYKKGDYFLSKKIINHSLSSIKTKRIRLGYLIGKKSPLKGIKRDPIIIWSKDEDEKLKLYYPILGYHKPKFHKSLIEMFPGRTQSQIRYHSEEVLKLKIDRQKDVEEGPRRCIECLKVKLKDSFYRDYNQCKKCKKKIWKENREDIFNLYFDRLSNRLKHEGIKLTSNKKKSLLKSIFDINGLPEKCFFEDDYCLSREDMGQFDLEIGHIKPKSKGGSLVDPFNVMWLCTRHNQMMGNRDLNELHIMIKSIIKNHNG